MQTPVLPRADAPQAPALRVAAAHPSPEECERYAKAQLLASEGLLVRVHLELCASCREHTLTIAARLRAETREAVQADAIPAGPRTAMRTLRYANWQADEPAATERGALEREADALADLPWRVPSMIRAVLADPDHPLPWRTIGPGVSALALPPTADGATVGLLRLAPGTPAPRHRHVTPETIQVLQGGFEDDRGVHHAGAYLQYPADGALHAAVALPSHGPCIALIRSAPAPASS